MKNGMMFALLVALTLASPGQAGEWQWEQANQEGMKAWKAGNDVQAEKYFRQAAAEAEKFPYEDLRYAKTLGNLAAACLNQGKNTEAEAALKLSLAAKEKALGKSNPTVANTLNDLGVLEYQKYNYQEAEAYYKRVLEMDEKNLPANHAERATTYENYAKLLNRMGKMKEAAMMEIKASTIRGTTPEPKKSDRAE